MRAAHGVFPGCERSPSAAGAPSLPGAFPLAGRRRPRSRSHRSATEADQMQQNERRRQQKIETGQRLFNLNDFNTSCR